MSTVGYGDIAPVSITHISLECTLAQLRIAVFHICSDVESCIIGVVIN